MAILRPTSRRARLASALTASAAVATVGFGAVARATAKRDVTDVDELVQRKLAFEPQHPVRRSARLLAPLGKWYTYLPAALALAAYSARARHTGFGRPRRRDRHAGSAAIVASGILAYALGKAGDTWLPQPPTPPGHRQRNKPVFPSGHAFGTGAVAMTSAYVLSRQGHLHAEVAAPVALTLPLLFSSTRLIDQRHWASDILGGYLAAVGVASACCAGYEARR